MKKQDNKDLVDEYAHKVKDLGKIEHIVFVKNLRNYFLHSDVPSLAITLNIVRDADGNDLETVDFSLGVDDDMLNWDGWHVNARSFLTKQMKQPNSKMNLQDLVRMHREDIDKLYHWLHREYMTVHKDAIGEANNLIIEHNRKMRDHAF